MPIGSLIFLTSRGDILLSRAFRGGVNIRALSDAFRTQIIATKMADRSPCNVLGSVSYLHMRHENLYVLATTRANANAALIFEFMTRFIHVLQAYFGTVNEEAIKEHFVLVQELLDECMDYGYPQNTEVALLKMYITSGGVKANVITSSEEAAKVAVKATGSVSWRREGIVHRKNEVFIDVLESVNLLMNQAGQILSRDVTGKVVMRCFLSGMPVCKFGLNDKLMLEKERAAGGRASTEIDLEDVSFHQCVRLGGFDSDRTISFVPPDGEFILMNYRATENVAPPFRVMGCVVNQLGKTRVELEFRVRAEFSPRLFGSDVVISVPVPPNTSSAKFNVGAGRAKYEGSKKVIDWKISRFPGGYEYHFSAEILLIASTSELSRWARPPISMKFSVPMLAASGLHVRFLKVVETKMSYQTVKWVRYISQAGQYECRI